MLSFKYKVITFSNISKKGYSGRINLTFPDLNEIDRIFEKGRKLLPNNRINCTFPYLNEITRIFENGMNSCWINNPSEKTSISFVRALYDSAL
jgi:hypothetical protein